MCHGAELDSTMISECSRQSVQGGVSLVLSGGGGAGIENGFTALTFISIWTMVIPTGMCPLKQGLDREEGWC